MLNGLNYCWLIISFLFCFKCVVSAAETSLARPSTPLSVRNNCVITALSFRLENQLQLWDFGILFRFFAVLAEFGEFAFFIRSF